MNKVFNINLGGYPFTIDEDAYEYLSGYLRTIHNHFRQSEGYEEITADIEARLAELFRESLGSRPIVILRDVEDAIAVMGTPEDFGAEPLDASEDEPVSETKEQKASDKSEEGKYRTGKRLFRNPEDEVVGGVCSGIAAYFGIADPVWVRLLFVIFTISGGFGIPLYIILWAILPKAESASDRLSMRGEPINVSNIGKIIEEEMENFSHKMTEFGDEFGTGWGKGKDKKKREEGREQVRTFLRQFFSGLGKVIRALIELLANIWKPILFIVMVAILIAFATGWIAAIIGLFFSLPFMDYVLPNAPFVPVMGVIALMIAIGIPLLMSAFGIGKRLFRFRINNYVQAGFWGIWVLSLIVMGFSISKTAQQFQEGTEWTAESMTDFPETDTLYIDLAGDPNEANFHLFNNSLEISGDNLLSHDVELNIHQSEDGYFRLEQKYMSRGYNTEEAGNLARQIDHRQWIEGNVLHIDPSFNINRGSKWRAQQVELTLYVPKGKVLVIQDRELQRHLHSVDFDRQLDRPWSMVDCASWTMGENGLYCPAYLESMSQTKTYNGQGYRRLHVDGKMILSLTYGETYSLEVVGRETDVEKVEIRQLDDLLNLSLTSRTTEVPQIRITTPALDHLDAEGLESLEVYGYEGMDMEIWLEEVEACEIFAKPNALNLRISGGGDLELRGEAVSMDLRMDSGAELDAGGFSVGDAKVNLSDGARAELWVTGSLQQELADGAEIEVKGDPAEQQ